MSRKMSLIKERQKSGSTSKKRLWRQQINKCREFLDKDERFSWVVDLSDHWLKLANNVDVQSQEKFNLYGILYDHSDELLYSAAREKARLDGVDSW